MLTIKLGSRRQRSWENARLYSLLCYHLAQVMHDKDGHVSAGS